MKVANSTKKAANGKASHYSALTNAAKFKKRSKANRDRTAILRKRKSTDEESSVSRKKSSSSKSRGANKCTRSSVGSKTLLGKANHPIELGSSSTINSDSESSDSDSEQETSNKLQKKQLNSAKTKKADSEKRTSKKVKELNTPEKVQARSTRSSISDSTVGKQANSGDNANVRSTTRKGNSDAAANSKKKSVTQVSSGVVNGESANEAKKKDVAVSESANSSNSAATVNNTSKLIAISKSSNNASAKAKHSATGTISESPNNVTVAASVSSKAMIKTPQPSTLGMRIVSTNNAGSANTNGLITNVTGSASKSSTSASLQKSTAASPLLAASAGPTPTAHSALAVNIGNQLNSIIRNIVNKHEHQMKAKDDEIRKLRQELTQRNDQLQQYHEVLQRNSVLESIHCQWNRPLMQLESSNSIPALEASTSSKQSLIVIEPEITASSDQVSSDHRYTRYSSESDVNMVDNAAESSGLQLSGGAEAETSAGHSKDVEAAAAAEESDCNITAVVPKKRKRVSERLRQNARVKIKKKSSDNDDDNGNDKESDDDNVNGGARNDVAGDGIGDKEGGAVSDKNASSSGNNDSSERGATNSSSQPAAETVAAMSSDEQRQRIMDAEQHLRGRHRIRKLIDGRKLCHETKAAQKTEKERRERMQKERENHVMERHTDAHTKEVVYTKCVLSKGHGDIPPVEISPKLLKKLKAHQVEAVEFMWDNVVESVKNPLNSGCILAHCMGLGKTLSVITFIKTLFDCPSLDIKRCLVICPLNTTLNWEQEFEKWLTKKERPKVYQLASLRGDNKERCALLSDWHRDGGVAIIGYQLFRILTSYRGRSNKIKATVLTCLLDPGPDIVICDEGHLLKNSGSQLAKCVNKIYTKRRVVLTGTPLQNNLIEYHCMVQFVKPQLLGTRHEFLNRFVNPITNGQHADSTPADVKLMKQRVHILHESLAGCVQRKDYSTIVQFLPPRREFVVLVRLSATQVKLYDKYLKDNVRLPAALGSSKNKGKDKEKDKIKDKEKDKVNDKDTEKDKAKDKDDEDESDVDSEEEESIGQKLFADHQMLMLVWQHPWLLKMHSARAKKVVEGDTDESWFEDSSDDEEAGSSGKDDDKANGKSSAARATRSARREETKIQAAAAAAATAAVVKSKCTIAGEVIRQWRSSRRHGAQAMDLSLADEAEDKTETHWYSDLVSDADHWSEEISGKMALLFDILRLAEQLGDKVLVFSQSVLTLDLIEDFLQHKTQQAKAAGTRKSKAVKQARVVWEAGLDYHRIDGTTAAHHRQEYMTDFCDPANSRLRLFLISTRAGGLGVNLEAANRVVLFDASWNPAHDIQSIFRAYRFGQTKPVYIYRLLAQGTMEEKIYERQVMKQTLSLRVVDEHQVDRHFSAADIAELYKFSPEQEEDPSKPLPAVPQDVLLADLMSQAKSKKWIATYHEHDSLLENRPDEELTVEERRAAWDEYERERDGIFTAAAALQFGRPAMMGINAAHAFADRRPIVPFVGGRPDGERPRFMLVDGQPVPIGGGVGSRFAYNVGSGVRGSFPSAYSGGATSGVGGAFNANNAGRPRPNNYWLSGLKWPKGRVFANGWLQVPERGKADGAGGEQKQDEQSGGGDEDIVDITPSPPTQNNAAQNLPNARPGFVMQNGQARAHTYRQRLKLVQQSERPTTAGANTDSQTSSTVPPSQAAPPSGNSGQGPAASAAASESSVSQSRPLGSSTPSPQLINQLCKQLNSQFSNREMREVQEVYLSRIVSEIMKYNPSITTEDLAARVRAFFVVHGWQQHRQLGRSLAAPSPHPTDNTPIPSSAPPPSSDTSD